MSSDCDVRRIPSARRFYLLQRIYWRDFDLGFDGVWRAKQEAQPGTTLPATFPALTALATAGYTTVEDLDGATEDELITAGLSSHDARSVIVARATL